MTAAARPAAATPHRTQPRPARAPSTASRACPADGPTRAYRTPGADGSPRACPASAAGLGARDLHRPGPGGAPAHLTVPPADAAASRDPYARLARGCRPRGCRAPARRVHGRRVRYVIGDEPGQVNGMRWRARTARPRHR
ncbi:tryptophan biosynthesis modulator TrpM [Streptomyces lavendofoliae]|uniref:tryptophan biosynthesis modulator TrpM n=1 Tax=Streptomyces lavendofoliae TaxID=67314 RepID=UPI00300EDD5B